MRVGITEVFVDDQDKARPFYAEVLGLVVKDDARFSATARSVRAWGGSLLGHPRRRHG
jgi:catechol 2,3-dioxygenase-like lactoylglutathione lyase family enzyme